MNHLRRVNSSRPDADAMIQHTKTLMEDVRQMDGLFTDAADRTANEYEPQPS